jgi:hypothetical protein
MKTRVRWPDMAAPPVPRVQAILGAGLCNLYDADQIVQKQGDLNNFWPLALIFGVSSPHPDMKRRRFLVRRG